MARPVEKKHIIEEAAIRLFAGKGLARTTIKDVAREAGVTEGALYRHYSGKNDMAWKLFCREIERFSKVLGAELFAPCSTVERLKRAVSCIFDYYRRLPTQFAFIMLTQHGFPDEQSLDAEINPNDMAVRFVREAQESGDIPSSDPVLAAGLAMGVVLQPLIMHRYKRLALTPEVEEEVTAAVQRVLKLI